MPSLEALLADLEGDRLSREGEIRLVRRFISSAAAESEKDMLKRTLVLLAYAHLEGFCRFSLLAYTSQLNSLRIQCTEAAYPVAAAGLHKVFSALRDINSKHDAFRQSLPDDAQLHLAAREQVFLESFERILQTHVEISDKVVDTRSNLSPDILKKMLFQLGLSYPSVEHHRATIHKLLGVRNAIAHGDRLKVPTDADIDGYIALAFDIMGFLQEEIAAALRNQTYLRIQEVPA